MKAVSAAAEVDLRDRLLTGRPLDLGALQHLLERDLPELAALAAVPEGPDEGKRGESALEHTQRVVDGVRPWLTDLPPAQARTLYLAALLHEAGRGEAGVPSRHERVGAALARQALFRLRVAPQLRDGVVHIVRSHGLPQALGRRPASTGRMLRLAWTLDTRLLYLLAVADCETGERPEACRRAVEAFRVRCQEMGIFGREPPPLLPPRRWQQLTPDDPWVRRRIAGELRLWRVKGIIDTPEQAEAWLRPQQPALAATLYLPVGVPGSGKSTWVAKNLAGVRVVSMDEMRERLLGNRADQSRNPEVYRRSRAILARLLQAGETGVWDAQSHTWASRQGLLSLARETHAYVIVVFFDVPLAIALERNRRRPPVVPEAVVRRSYLDLEEPRPFEAEEIWRVGVDGRCTRYVWDEAAGA